MSKYHLRRIIREDLPPTKQLRWNEEYIRFPYIDGAGDTVMYKWLGIERQDGKKEIGSTVPQYATLWGHWLVNDNTKQVLITEGEVDAMSVDQMCPDVPTLSMPTGASNLDWINNDYERLQQFEKIYILTDMDSAGEAAAQKIAKRLGLTRCFRISLPDGYKDANDFLLSKEHGKPHFQELIDNAKTYDPQQLRSASDYAFGVAEEIARFDHEKESNNFLWSELPFRFRHGEMTVVTGYPPLSPRRNDCGHGLSRLRQVTAYLPDGTTRDDAEQPPGLHCQLRDTSQEHAVQFAMDAERTLAKSRHHSRRAKSI
jgi:5S rRNA maturation endonuclease (ribonuclease M5)